MYSKLILSLLIFTGFSATAQKYGWAKAFAASANMLQPGKNIARDASGNLYNLGTFRNTIDLDPSPAIYNVSAGQGMGFYVVKLSPSGDFLSGFATSGGTNVEVLEMVLDTDGSIYVCGSFSGSVDFDPGTGAVILSATTSSNMYLAKYSNSGALIWVKQFGLAGSGSHVATGISLDYNHDVYMSGNFTGALDVDPGPQQIIITSSIKHAVIIKLTSSGTYLNYYHFDMTGLHTICEIVFKNNYLYVAGYIGVKGAITKMTGQLEVVWQKITQGSGNANPQHLVVDDAGNAIVSGTISGSVDFDPGPGVAAINASTGFSEYFVFKLDASGNFCWRFKPFFVGYGQSLATGQNGDIYLAGGYDASGSAGAEASIQKFNSLAVKQWDVFFKGPGTQTCYDILVDEDENVFTSGYVTNTGDFNPDPNTADSLYVLPGQGTAFISKLSKGNKITGNVYLDVNNDGIRQPQEEAFIHGTVGATKGLRTYAGISGNNGDYTIYVDTGRYIINGPVIPAYYQLNTPAQEADFRDTIGAEDSHHDFPIHPIPGINDLSVSLYPNNIARPGITQITTLSYTNHGTTTLSGNIIMQHSPLLGYIQSSPIPTSYSNFNLSWNFVDLKPFESRIIRITFNNPPTLSIGDTIRHVVDIYPGINDSTPLNNHFYAKIPVVTSYDPNDKKVMPDGPISTGTLAMDTTWLDYTVRFQNTGTDTAFLVNIADTIQGSLDLSTLRIRGASHPYTVILEKDNVLNFTFREILLPDSSTNEPESHGFIAYSIKPLKTLGIGATIKNRAAIYFDYNTAVITNQTINTVVGVLPVTLSNFSLLADAQCRVNLGWTSASEINNAFYTIERSLDNVSWTAIDRVVGAGNSHLARSYQYVDPERLSGMAFYRLRQTDLDGRSTYSFTGKVNCLGKKSFVEISPNPARDQILIKSDNAFTWTIYSQHGVAMMSGRSLLNQKSFSIGNLPSGSYILSIKKSDGVSYHRFLKL